MPIKERDVSLDVLGVLGAATVRGNVVVLPPGQLDRKLYEQVNAVLVDLGGRWKTRVGHVFPSDPTNLLDEVLLSGRVAGLALNGYFPTPPELVQRVCDLAEPLAGASVLEPSAGTGAIADELRARGADVTCVELLPEHRERLQAAGHRVLWDDFTTLDTELRFDRVVMNPPYSKQQDIAHVTRAHALLRPGGLVVALMAAGVSFRTDKKAAAFRLLLNDCGGWWEHNEPEAFKASGTMVRTVTVFLPATPGTVAS